MQVTRLILDVRSSPIDYEGRWGSIEAGLVTSWQRGIEMASEKPLLAAEALGGRLVVLPWKGGVEKSVKAVKVGVHFYLAMWQGLRGENLDIDPSEDVSLTCTGTGVTVVFTSDYSKYSSA